MWIHRGCSTFVIVLTTSSGSSRLLKKGHWTLEQRFATESFTRSYSERGVEEEARVECSKKRRVIKLSTLCFPSHIELLLECSTTTMNKILHFAIRLIEFTSAWRIAATLFYNWIRLAASSGCCSLHLNVFCECLWTPNSFFLHASIPYRNSTTQLISLIFYQYNPRFPNFVSIDYRSFRFCR